MTHFIPDQEAGGSKAGVRPFPRGWLCVALGAMHVHMRVFVPTE